MTSAVGTIIRAKRRIIDNILAQVRSYLWIHLAAGIFTLFLLIAGGGAFFYYLFRFLLAQEPFGAGLMEKLVGIVLLAFFSMLTFSNLIITLTTTYISRETEFLMAFPVGFRGLFLVKLIESIFYSSWAFVILSLPLFLAYGISKNAAIGFYPLAFLLGFPFLIIPAAMGAVITMIISTYFPARKARIYSVVLLAAALGITAAIVRLMGLRSMLASSDVQDFSQIMAFLNASTMPLLPNYWLARGMQSASLGNYSETFYWFFCLLSTALMSVQICLWLVPRFYYRGWALAKETASPTAAASRHSLFSLADRVLMIFSQPVRALISKDMRTFWRDPAQWSQLIILFGLLLIYISNISGLSRQMRGLDQFLRHWPTVLSFFNISATCFVLSILTTRFVYPMLSLEGKQYWVVGLAPFPKHKLVWEKYGICVLAAVATGLPLMLFSNWVLESSRPIAVLSTVTIIVIAFGLSSLAVGLGAIFPDFKEDNPARIANGLGGTLNIVLSLAYIAANIAIEIMPALYMSDMAEGRLGPGNPFVRAIRDLWPYAFGFAALNALVIVAPMRIGIRRWNRIEFHL